MTTFAVRDRCGKRECLFSIEISVFYILASVSGNAEERIGRMKIRKGMEEAFDLFVRENRRDSYTNTIVEYMQRWADMMEEETAKGKTIPDMAGETSHRADDGNLSGFMFGIAVHALAEFWEYGEELRVWHNSRHGYHGDGTVNQAVLVCR